MKRTVICGILLLSLLLCACTSTGVPPVSDFADEDADIVRLCAVGDLSLTDAMIADARTPEGTYDFTALFQGVISELSDADVVFGNLEGNFAGAPYGAQSGSYPEEFAEALRAVGFSVIQTANSYSVYNGMNGLESTLQVLRNAGLQTVGSYASEKEQKSNRAILYEVNGVRIAFIALTKGMDGMSLPEGEEYRVDRLYTDYNTSYSKIDYTMLDETVQAAKALRPDFIIAGLHWGSENNDAILSSQEKIADYLISSGVDVILGSHSHRVAKVERRTVTVDGREKTAVIAYGLGDLCCVEENGVKLSAILHIQLRKHRESGTTDIGTVRCTAAAAIDRGEESTARYRIVDAKATVALYEGNYYDIVEKEIYDALVSGLKKFDAVISPEE